MLTADTIADAELDVLRREGNFYARVALETRMMVSPRTRDDARARCAEIINARTKKAQS